MAVKTNGGPESNNSANANAASSKCSPRAPSFTKPEASSLWRIHPASSRQQTHRYVIRNSLGYFHRSGISHRIGFDFRQHEADMLGRQYEIG